MNYAFNPLDPMNQSMYLESMVPDSIDSAIATLPDYGPGPNPNGPKLRPQPSKDSWYYNKDRADDGHISTFEKLKAFVKGGTYNMVRGMFCDKDGFSFGRTLATAAGITAIALTGPIGAAVAGGLGLVCAADNLAQSVRNARYATTDQEAREAYEGVGESTTTAGLAIFGGFKGIQAIKNNFAYAKANNIKIKLKDKLTKWDVRKLYPIPTNPTPTGSGGPTPTGSGGPAPTGSGGPTPTGTGGPTPTGSGGPTPTGTGGSAPTGTGGSAPTGTGGPAPTGTGSPTPTGARTVEANPINYEIDGTGYVPDWKPTGYPPKPTTVEYVPDWKPVGEVPPKTVAPEYFSPYEPINPELLKPAPKATTSTNVPEFIADTAPINPAVINPPKPQYNFEYGQNNNHFFG